VFRTTLEEECRSVSCRQKENEAQNDGDKDGRAMQRKRQCASLQRPAWWLDVCGVIDGCFHDADLFFPPELEHQGCPASSGSPDRPPHPIRVNARLPIGQPFLRRRLNRISFLRICRALPPLFCYRAFEHFASPASCATPEATSHLANQVTMDVTDILPQLERLDGEIDNLEEVLQPLLGSLSDVSSKLPLLDKAKLYVLVTYAIESMLFCQFPYFSPSRHSTPILIYINSFSASEWRQRKGTSGFQGADAGTAVL
jgi:hypothetical protein